MTVVALNARDYELATDEKTAIEDRQRQEAAVRADEGVEWRPRLFRPVRGGPGGSEEGEEDLDWILNANVDSYNPSLATKQILSVAPILEGQKFSHQFDIPKRSPIRSQTPVARDFGNTNLIDFGDDDTQEQIQYTNAKTSGALIDLLGSDGDGGNTPDPTNHGGMIAPLQPMISPQQQRTLKRKDSTSSDFDEFVDAEG